MGRLTRDPELRWVNGDTAICNFGLAVNRTWNDRNGQKCEDVAFIDCEAWGRTAEVIHQHHCKGDQIHITGRLKYETWQDKSTGQNRHKIRVVAERFAFCKTSKGEPNASRSAQRQPAAQAPDEDDIPF